MGIIGGSIGYRILSRFCPREGQDNKGGTSQFGGNGLICSFGDTFFDNIKGKIIIDFGCGCGLQAVEMAQKGAKKVIGIDIQDGLLEKAKELADANGLSGKCLFSRTTEVKADIIISRDAFEHFENPGYILDKMSKLLKPKGYVLAAFGPTWLHPYGGHLFSVFPWAHLIFTEKALIRWRSKYKSDGANCFQEVNGGLNKITIGEFKKIVARSPFRFAYIETVPIKGISLLKTYVLREIGTSLVRCKLVMRE